jgi:hypothetical protein
MPSNHQVLTPEDALDIYRRAMAGENQAAIARDHVISQATVSGIKCGYYWNDVTGHKRTRPLTPRQELTLAIYSAYWDKKMPVPAIAQEYGVSRSTVYDIRNGTTRSEITGHPFPKPRKRGPANGS